MREWQKTIIICATGFSIGFVLTQCVAKADDYCSLWAREQTMIDITSATDFTTLTSSQPQILKDKAKNLLLCQAMDMKPLLEGDNSDEAWSLRVYRLLIVQAEAYATAQGTEPADEKPGDEAWREQCRAEYRTWDEDTGTVVRRGSHERVRCPCGGDVACG